MSLTRDDMMAGLERAGSLVEHRVRPGGTFDGWDGRDVLCHLGAYARLVGAILLGEAERRRPSTSELYGRELSNEELAIVGLDDVNEAVRREYEGLSYDQALAFWRAMHDHVVTQAARLTDDQLAAPGPVYPPNWSREHLSEVVTALIRHYEGHMGAER
jgi:Mycothiol maleylpyruvate isomerase N-terminal domain